MTGPATSARPRYVPRASRLEDARFLSRLVRFGSYGHI
jgi:hypothetical protein